MKILLIGSGGREHCLAWKMSLDKRVKKIYAIPGNAGIDEIAECFRMDISKNGFNALSDFALQKKIDLIVVGPEAPLVDGIVDHFKSKGLRIFGPDKKAAQIEGSKVFSKELLLKYNIPTAKGSIFAENEYLMAKDFINSLEKYPVVLKADGLAAGKGVIIAVERSEAINAVDDFFIKHKFGESGNKIIVEEYLEGFEVSILCLCDGKRIIPMEPAQDYKRIFDNDNGKNTGGMGSYSPVPMADNVIIMKSLNNIITPTYEALKEEGIEYKGILYAGILVRKNEPYLLEYNCRFGDPETQAVIPRLEENLIDIFNECIDGNLTRERLNWDPQKCVCVVAASKGYPESSSSGDIIYGLEELKGNNDALIFHAGTARINDRIATAGGRVLGITAKAETFTHAREKVYHILEKISFDGIQYRKDIAKKVEEVYQ